MKTLYHILKIFLKAISIPLFFLFAISFISPFYSFPTSTPFAGENIYNPYQEMAPNNWVKANFQVQSKAWGGITNGWNNTDSLIFNRYKDLGFDMVSISDYQKINRYQNQTEAYIPVYEHGYGIFKNHQVCLGSKKVEWLDFPIFHTLHHKQHILNRLRNNNELVAIAHPGLWDAYSHDDMRQLTNYDLIKMLNNYKLSDGHWDAALSSGHPVFLLANDDAHDVSRLAETGRRFTVINTPELKKDNLLSSLKSGLSYGVDLENSDSVITDKATKIAQLPKLLSVDVQGDTIHFAFSGQASALKYIGQEGEIMKTDLQTASGFYVMNDDDTYIRLVAEFEDQGTIYLNPVFRHGNNPPLQMATAHIDMGKTNLFRYSLFVFLLLIIAFGVYSKWISGTRPKAGVPQPA